MVKQYSQAYYVAKYMKLYSAVFCCIEYGRAAPSKGLPVSQSSETHYDQGCRDGRQMAM